MSRFTHPLNLNLVTTSFFLLNILCHSVGIYRIIYSLYCSYILLWLCCSGFFIYLFIYFNVAFFNGEDKLKYCERRFLFQKCLQSSSANVNEIWKNTLTGTIIVGVIAQADALGLNLQEKSALHQLAL